MTDTLARPRVRNRAVDLHGHVVTFIEAGERTRGRPTVLLIHGIAGRASTWDHVIAQMAADVHVVAPDLLGHGGSAKPRGDYSLGAFASGLRDLLIALDVDGATVVGHSLGGGVALQFAYQFPQMTRRLALMSSGGLGREVDPILRACALPGAQLVLPAVCNGAILGLGRLISQLAMQLGYEPSPEMVELARSYAAVAETDARSAFVHTLRSVVDVWGQRGDATDRLYLAENLPTMILWGANDRIIPVAHGHAAAEEIPGARLEVLADAGHFPHRDDPDRVAELLLGFVASTEGATKDARDLREAVLEHGGFLDDAGDEEQDRRRQHGG